MILKIKTITFNLTERHVPGKPCSRGCGLALEWLSRSFELIFNFTRFWYCKSNIRKLN